MGYMAIKIDLEKAYDKLEWSFIRRMLIRINLPTNLVDLIMSCVSSVTTLILFNGSPLDLISLSRGIRQGDPLFLYIFILYVDYLSQLIEEKCNNKMWSSVKASRSGPAFLHLMFADDLVLFAKADLLNCSSIRDVLDEFCAMSGQTISESKSRVYFSPNVDQDSRESLSDILGCRSTLNLGKYLGIPIKHPNSSSQDFNFILDRIKGKLAGWKANLLSLARRVVLVQTSTSTIPSYAMQCSYLPDRILQGVDHVNKNFLWGLTDTVKKMHWVGWHKVTKLKSEGGLGLQTAKGKEYCITF